MVSFSSIGEGSIAEGGGSDDILCTGISVSCTVSTPGITKAGAVSAAGISVTCSLGSPSLSRKILVSGIDQSYAMGLPQFGHFPMPTGIHVSMPVGTPIVEPEPLDHHYLYYAKATAPFVEGENVYLPDGTLVGTIIETKKKSGFYRESEGPSSLKKIQDSFFYQEYSYVLRTAVTVNKFKDVVKALLHPAGTKMFGQLLVTDAFNSRQADLVTETQLTIELQSAEFQGLPHVLTDRTFENEDEAGAFEFELVGTADMEPDTERSMSRYNNTFQSGTSKIINSGVMLPIDDLPMSYFDEWTEDDFTNGRGLVSTDLDASPTAILSSPANTTHGILIDNTNTYANGLFQFRNATSYTALLAPAYYSTTSANLSIIVT